MSRKLFKIALSVLVSAAGCVDTKTETEDTDEDAAEQDLSIGLAPAQVWNLAGVAEVYSPLGSITELRATNPFFKNLGTSGRTCESCHSVEGGFTTSAAIEDWIFSGGTDPLFMHTFDNGLCPDSDISTPLKRLQAMKLTLERGSTRGTARIQPTAEFEMIAVSDPYNCSGTNLTTFFTYRKPNPTTGVSQKTSVTWAPGPQPDMRAALKGFFVGATQLHGQTTYLPTDEEQNQAADFMLHNYFAQVSDFTAGRLDDDGARCGPHHLANQDWFVGINHARPAPRPARCSTSTTHGSTPIGAHRGGTRPSPPPRPHRRVRRSSTSARTRPAAPARAATTRRTSARARLPALRCRSRRHQRPGLPRVTLRNRRRTRPAS